MSIDQLSDDDIVAEVRKLQYLYGLKRVIRYAQSRTEEDTTESVAEHIYGMHILAQYFLTYEDPEEAWDHAKIFRMISLHDIDEIETGDEIGFLKTQAMRDNEAAAMQRVALRAPARMQSILHTAVVEYEVRKTHEALFVRAIDKFEPLVHLYSEQGILIHERLHTTIEKSRSIKDEHVRHFASIKRFTDVLHERMVQEGYFYTPSA